MEMPIEDVLRHLPHRYPFLLIDRVTELVPNVHIKGYKNITFNEPYFQGHFPNLPIMPGVMMIEAMAQIAGILIIKSGDYELSSEPQFVLAGVDNVRIKKMVKPGDRLDFSIKLDKVKRHLWCFSGEASVDSKLVISASIMNAEVAK